MKDKFYHHLQKYLPKSTAADRTVWATRIVKEKICLRELSDLLYFEREVATRFLWLLSDVGDVNSAYLLKELPFLFELSSKIHHLNIRPAFAKYWSLAGIPSEHEGEAMDLLFGWLLSSDAKVTLKSNAVFALLHLTQKYPELKHELKVSLEEQVGKYSLAFDQRLRKILKELES